MRPDHRLSPRARFEACILALVHAMAVQINAAIQKAYANLFEKMGTMVLSRLKTFAKTKRMAEITGKAERSMLIEFSGDSIKAESKPEPKRRKRPPCNSWGKRH